MVITLFHPSYHHTLGASGRIAIATKMKLFMCILIIPCAEKYPKLATSVTIALAASIILTITVTIASAITMVIILVIACHRSHDYCY